MINETFKQTIFIHTFLRTGFVLFMSVYISVGHLTEYLDCFDSYKIEIVEESETEPEEKEGRDKIEKDKILNNPFFCNFLNQQKLHSLPNTIRKWNISPGDIPTPPPKILLV